MSSTGNAAKPKPENSKTEKEKPKPENSKTEKEKPKPEKKKAPTKVQLEKWSSSINSLLSDPDGVEAFRAFLLEMELNGEEGEYTKYIDFYLECEKYRARFKDLEGTAKQIFEDYLALYEVKNGAFYRGYIVSETAKIAKTKRLFDQKDAAHQPILLQVGADKEVGTGGKSVEIGDKLEEEGLEGVTLFDEPQKKVKQKLADGLYINFCLDIKKKLKL